MTHEENVVWISLNDVRCAVLSCSAHEAEPLAVGHLLAEGWIGASAAVSAVEKVAGPGGCIGVQVYADDARIAETQALQRHQTNHGCGVRHFLDCEPGGISHVGGARADLDAVPLLRLLFAAAERDVAGGGVHAVAVSDGTDLKTLSYDVARHCAIDRAIGSGALHGIDLSTAGLVSTARISAAMVVKAVRCRIRWIASRSIATTLARELAGQYGITLIERAGGRMRGT